MIQQSRATVNFKMNGIGIVKIPENNICSETDYLKRKIFKTRENSTQTNNYENGTLIKKGRKYFIVVNRTNFAYQNTIEVIIPYSKTKIKKEIQLITVEATKIADIYEYNFLIYEIDGKKLDKKIKNMFTHLKYFNDEVPKKDKLAIISYTQYNFSTKKESSSITQAEIIVKRGKIINDQPIYDPETKILLLGFILIKKSNDNQIHCNLIYSQKKHNNKIYGLTIGFNEKEEFLVVPSLIVNKIFNQILEKNKYSGLCKLNLNYKIKNVLIEKINGIQNLNKLTKSKKEIYGLKIKDALDYFGSKLKENDIILKIDNKKIYSNGKIKCAINKKTKININIDLYVSIFKTKYDTITLTIIRKKEKEYSIIEKKLELCSWEKIRRIPYSFANNFNKENICHKLKTPENEDKIVLVEPSILFLNELIFESNIKNKKMLVQPISNKPKIKFDDIRTPILLWELNNAKIKKFYEIHTQTSASEKENSYLTTWKLAKISNENVNNIEHLKELIKKNKKNKKSKIKFIFYGNQEDYVMKITYDLKNEKIKKFKIEKK